MVFLAYAINQQHNYVYVKILLFPLKLVFLAETGFGSSSSNSSNGASRITGFGNTGPAKPSTSKPITIIKEVWFSAKMEFQSPRGVAKC